jgi:multicomponent Na+:H+ antiporter subunit G
MTLDLILDIAAGICLLIGALLSLAAAIGLLRFPDALSRLHAATKPQILGLIFVVIAIALSSRSWPTLLVLAPIILFQLLLTPVAGHMVGRAGYRTKNFRRDLLLVDELQDAVDKASDR